eukprot:5389690-Prymnesium_polylepis.1
MALPPSHGGPAAAHWPRGRALSLRRRLRRRRAAARRFRRLLWLPARARAPRQGRPAPEPKPPSYPP